MRRFETVQPYINDELGMIIQHEDCRYENGIRKVERFTGIGMTQAKVIARNVLNGVEYRFASPMYEVSRSMIAFIHVNAYKILSF